MTSLCNVSQDSDEEEAEDCDSVEHVPSVTNINKKKLPRKPDNCKNLPSKRFWTSDLHDGTRLDLPTALADLGQKVVIAGEKKSKTPYPVLWEKENIFKYENISPTLLKYAQATYNPTQSDIEANYEFYKKNDAVNSTDAFICQFPSSMCQLWFPFEKPIAFITAHRSIKTK